MTLLLESRELFAALCGLIGLLIGSFLNVVIHRIPVILDREEQDWLAAHGKQTGDPADASAKPFNLFVPRSRCPSCGHRIRALENIPILSYLALRGKCSACGVAIGLRYPVVEALTGLLSAWVAWRMGPAFSTLAALTFVYFLIALAFIDVDTQLLPDRLTLPLVWLGLLVTLYGIGFTSLPSAVLGTVCGYASLWAVYHLFKLLTGKEGMGYGDFKLFAAIGAWLGWQQLPLVILLASLAGAILGGAMLILARRGKDVPIPFGPYLAIAGFVALLHGTDIIRAYLDLFQ